MIVARAWRDAEYKSRLIDDPRAAFAAEGIAVPDELAITVTCDSESCLNMLLGDGPAPGPATALPERPDVRAVFAHIDARCRDDQAFRAAFLADPTGTVRGLGCALPEDVTVTVHVARPDHAYFNLPLPPRAQMKVDRPRSYTDQDEPPLYFPVPMGVPGVTPGKSDEVALYFAIPLGQPPQPQPQPQPQQPQQPQPQPRIGMSGGSREAALYFPIPIPPRGLTA